MANISAKTSNGKTILALDAERGKDYTCPECASLVRLRMGEERRPHFFHLDPPASCRQAGKSLEHLSVQLFIKDAYVKEGMEAHIEHRFPKIGRIADVYIPANKLVFEIQCSPMEASEAIERNKDYKSLGINVVWILHTMTFLKNKASPFERAIESAPHYFTSMDAKGRGDLFDLYAPIHRLARLRRSRRYPIEITSSSSAPASGSFRQGRPLFFKGDIAYLLKERGLDEETQRRILWDEAVKTTVYSKTGFEWKDPFRKGMFFLKTLFNELLLSCSSDRSTDDKGRR